MQSTVNTLCSVLQLSETSATGIEFPVDTIECIQTTPSDVIITIPGMYILYSLMLKDGFYSAAPLDSPRVKK